MTFLNPKLKWYHVYYILGLVNVITIFASVYVNHTTVDIFKNSVYFQSIWSSKELELKTLSKLSSEAAMYSTKIFFPKK